MTDAQAHPDNFKAELRGVCRDFGDDIIAATRLAEKRPGEALKGARKAEDQATEALNTLFTERLIAEMEGLKLRHPHYEEDIDFGVPFRGLIDKRIKELRK